MKNRFLVFDIFWTVMFFTMNILEIWYSATIELGCFSIIILGWGFILSRKLSYGNSRVGMFIYWFSNNILRPKNSQNYVKWGYVLIGLSVWIVVSPVIGYVTKKSPRMGIEQTPKFLLQLSFFEQILGLVAVSILCLGIYWLCDRR